MAQQTAVDWLMEQMLKPDMYKIWPTLLERAKAMEKEQLKKAYYTDAVSRPLGVFTSLTPVLKTFENYYNETYNK
jgi:hypothetical protein